MKQITVLSAALVMGGGMLLAQTTGSSTTSTSADRDRAKGDQKQKMSAEIVSTDASAKTITVKNLAMAKSDKDRSTSATGAMTGQMGPAETTLRLEGKAADRAGSFKAGDKVMLVCKTNAAVTGTEGMSGARTTTPGTTGTATSPSRPDTPTPNPEGTTTRTDPTKPPSQETDQPGSSTGTPPKRDARDMASDPMAALQSCQSVTEISKSGS
jgi:hypothetical protein